MAIRVGSIVQFMRNNTNGGADFGRQGQRATVTDMADPGILRITLFNRGGRQAAVCYAPVADVVELGEDGLPVEINPFIDWNHIRPAEAPIGGNNGEVGEDELDDEDEFAPPEEVNPARRLELYGITYISRNTGMVKWHSCGTSRGEAERVLRVMMEDRVTYVDPRPRKIILTH